MKKLFAIAVALCSLNAFALTTVELSMDVNGTDLYTLMSEDTFAYKKLYSLASGIVHVKIVVDGEVIANMNQPVNTREDAKGKQGIIVLEKDLVRLVDINPSGEVPTNIDAQVKAKVKIKRDYIKSIKIKSAEIQAVYEEVLTKMGLNQLRGMQMNVDDAQIATDFSMSDMNCAGKRGEKTISCKQNIKLSIKASGN